MKIDKINALTAAFVAVSIFMVILAVAQAFGTSKQKAVECGFAYDGGGCNG